MRLLRWAQSALLLAAIVASATVVRAENTVKAQRNLVEIGVFGGILLAPDDHEFYETDWPPLGRRKINDIAPEFGLRVAYLPIAWAGIEIEGALMPTSVDGQGDASTMLYAIRGHLLAQYPARLAPFVVVGGGLYGASSDDPAIGDDKDGVFHWGLGLKWYAHPRFLLRLDGRHIVAPKIYPGGRTSHFEVLAGLSYIIGYEADADGDGVDDDDDQCPKQAGKQANGCPWGDSDGDGVKDNVDRCPDKSGEAAHEGCPNPDSDGDSVPNDKDDCPNLKGSAYLKGCPDTDSDGVADGDDRCPKLSGVVANAGCPADRDKDGVADDKDRCPSVAGVAANAGCPADRDKDGVADDKDRCPDKAETKNGFQDEDGCPDVLPKKVKRFTGAIRGIYFATGQAKVRKKSHAVLDRAIKVLKSFPSLKLQIRGHSDDRGKRAFNLELSKKRADAVRDYLQGKGIAAERLSSQGLGPDEPVANNKTRTGRAKNRRIEFKVVIN